MKSRTTARAIKDPSALGQFIAPRTEAEYDRAVAYLNTLVDEIGDDPANSRYQHGCMPLLTAAGAGNCLGRCGDLRVTAIQPR